MGHRGRIPVVPCFVLKKVVHMLIRSGKVELVSSPCQLAKKKTSINIDRRRGRTSWTHTYTCAVVSGFRSRCFYRDNRVDVSDRRSCLRWQERLGLTIDKKSPALSEPSQQAGVKTRNRNNEAPGRPMATNISHVSSNLDEAKMVSKYLFLCYKLH